MEFKKNFKKMGLAGAIAGGIFTNSLAQFSTEEAPMMRGVTKNIKNGWETYPALTVGETNNNGDDVNLNEFGYKVPGILDGMAAWKKGSSVKVLINHEVNQTQAYEYFLSNGTKLVGSRISAIEFSKKDRSIQAAGLAYVKVFDRAGSVVTNPAQINEGSNPGSNYGFDRFCSSYGVKKWENGFTRDIYFTGEETSNGQLAG